MPDLLGQPQFPFFEAEQPEANVATVTNKISRILLKVFINKY